MATYIVLMGMQGAGKGTQAKRLQARYHLPQVSTGDLFRAMKTKDTPLAREVQAIMNRGDLIPDEITIEVVRERLQQPDAVNGAIFDGFPRTLPQAEALDKLLAEFGGRITSVPFFDLPREEAIARISDRWQSPDGQEIYNLRSNPPAVAGKDSRGNTLIQRPDDTPEAAAHRIDLYLTQTMPLLNYYKQRSLVDKVNANQDIEAVTQELLAYMAARGLNA